MSLFLLTETFAYIDVNDKIVHVNGTAVEDRGTWSASIAYQPNDVVQYLDSLYIATTASFNLHPTSVRDDSWSCLVRFARLEDPSAMPSLAEVYQIAVSGSNLAWSLSGGTFSWPSSGTSVTGDYIPDQNVAVHAHHLDYGLQADQINSGQLPYNVTYPTVSDALDALFYVPLQVTVFSNTGDTVEVGQTITSMILAWAYNKPITSQSMNQGVGVLSPAVRTINVSGVWTAGLTYTVTASDGVISVSGSTSLSFMQCRYWGVSASTSLADADIRALSQEFASSLGQSRSLVAASQYLYFAYPASFGLASFTVNGLLNTAWTLTTRSFVNASGYSSSYNIYRSDNLLTGTYSVALS